MGTKYQGTGKIAASDYKAVKWVGVTHSGLACTIELKKAINLTNIDWTMQEKNDVVPSLEYAAVYSNTNSVSDSAEEPWTVEINGTLSAGAQEIVLGAGEFFVGGASVGLSRGGGKFTVEREYREINADGDRGPVENRIVMESSRAKLTMNVLTMLTKMADLYPAVSATVTQ